MVDAAGDRVSQSRAAARAVVHVRAVLAELKAGERDGAALSEPVQLGVVLPDIAEIILVYAAQHHMRYLSTRHDGPVSTHRDLVHGSTAAGKKAAARHLAPFLTRLLHFQPSPSFGQRAGRRTDPAVILGGQSQQCFHGQEPFLGCELDYLGILPTEAEVGRGIGGKTRQTDFFEQEARDVLKVTHVLAMDRHPHRDRQVVALEVLYTIHGFPEAAPAPAGIMGYRYGAVN